MVQVTRNLFFTGKHQYLRYAENSPEIKECDHSICNCTKAVTKRPDGEPHQKQQYIYYTKEDKYYKYEVSLASTGAQFTLRWPGETLTESPKGSQKNHAYFWFNSNGVENMLQIEITLPNYGNVDCFFGHLYLGNTIDTSCFFNGHSNSQIVDLTEIKKDDLWMHTCEFGSEVISFLRECDEAVEWRKVYGVHKKIQDAARTYDQDFVSDVQTIREAVEKDTTMLQDVEKLCHWFRIVTKNLKETEMYRCGDYCYKNGWKEN